MSILWACNQDFRLAYDQIYHPETYRRQHVLFNVQNLVLRSPRIQMLGSTGAHPMRLSQKDRLFLVLQGLQYLEDGWRVDILDREMNLSAFWRVRDVIAEDNGGHSTDSDEELARDRVGQSRQLREHLGDLVSGKRWFACLLSKKEGFPAAPTLATTDLVLVVPHTSLHPETRERCQSVGDSFLSAFGCADRLEMGSRLSAIQWNQCNVLNAMDGLSTYPA